MAVGAASVRLIGAIGLVFWAAPSAPRVLDRGTAPRADGKGRAVAVRMVAIDEVRSRSRKRAPCRCSRSRNLTVEFPTLHGAFKAVDAVDLAVDQGEIVAIVGESGSGKSVSTCSRSWACCPGPPG